MHPKTIAFAALPAAAAWWPPEIYGEFRYAFVAAAVGVFLWETVRNRLSPPGWLGAAALFFALNVAFAAAYRHAALDAALMFAAYTLVGILAFHGEPRRHVALVGVLAATGAALALYGVHQAGWGLEALAAKTRALDIPDQKILMERIASGRVNSRFALPATFGGWLALALPPTVGAALAVKSPLARRLLWAAAALMGANLLLTQSLGAMAALACAAIVVLGWIHRRSKAVLAVLTAAALALGGFAAVRSWEWTRAGHMTHHPAWSRLANWQAAVEMWKENPAMGKGLDAYGLAYPRFRKPGMNETRYAHNSYLQLLAEGGLLAALLLAWLLSQWARRMGAARDPLSLGLETGCLAFLVHNAADFTLYMPSVGFAFAVFAGLVLRRRHEVLPDGAQAPSALSRSWTRALAATLGGGALGAVLAMASADRLYRRAQDEYENGHATRAIQTLQSAQAWWPWRAEPFIYEAKVWLLRAATASGERPSEIARKAAEQALAKADRAIALNPLTPFHYAVRSEAFHRLGDWERAEEDLAAARRLYPLKREYAATPYHSSEPSPSDHPKEK